jgi:hypothetical protein
MPELRQSSFFPLFLPFAPDCQHFVGNLNVDVFLLHARKLDSQVL